ncbi:MAG: DUF4340 domain-containing protein [Deltaproteobacteria bacterium]|nr:DUF4340 domain-containing protein [Deltaproteobacteria bacterium]
MTRKTLAALGIFALLLVLVLIVKLMPEQTTEIAWAIPKLSETMDRVEITRQDTTVVLEKKGDQWAITQPKVYQASESAVKGLLELFEKPIGMDLKVPVKKEELARFEVEGDKGITVKIGVSGREVVAFVLGKSQGSRTFIKPLSEDVVYRAKATMRWKLDKGLAEWREKKIIGVEQTAASRVEITQPEGTRIELVKEGDKWKITQPAEHAADSSAISSLLGSLTSLQAADFADDIAPEAAGLGPADKPYTLVVSTTSDGEKGPQGIEVGQQVSKEQLEGKYPEDFFARRKGEVQIFVVRSYSVKNLRKKLTELKDRTVLSLDREQVIGLTLKTPQQEMVFEKVEELWEAKQPAELVGKLDPAQVSSLTSAISTLRAEELAEEGTKPEDVGLAPEPSSGRVEIRLKDGGTKALLLGKKEEGDNAKIFAKLADRETIYKLSDYSSRRFLGSPGTFRKAEGGPSPGMPGMPTMPGMMPPGMMPPGME